MEKNTKEFQQWLELFKDGLLDAIEGLLTFVADNDQTDASRDKALRGLITLREAVESLPDAAVDLQPDGTPVNPNAGVKQVYPNGRWT